jgi:uncharacterized protein YkwD
VVASVVEAHNRERARAGLRALTVDDQLVAAARNHAEDMAARRRMSHRGSDGSSPFNRMEAEDYRYRQAAENIACGRFTVESLMRGWMRSLPHRRNVLGPYSQLGAACAIASDGSTYWCVTFGQPFAS